MRQLYHLLCFLLLVSLKNELKAQTPIITVNLSANPDTIWSVTNISRNGLLCGATGSKECIKFDITVSPQTAQIGFNVLNPAPPGGATYQLNCGTPTSLGTRLCVSGLTTFSITFCKSGNDQPTYTISAGRGYSTSGNIALRADGSCAGLMNVQGLQKPSIIWTSIYPGAQGAYNSYLSCTSGCDTTNVIPASGAPPYIDYKVCGIVTGCMSGTVCSTIRVYTYPALNVAITPVNPVICSGGPSSVTLAATSTGGNPSYTYSWTGPNGFTSNLQSPTVNAGGIYTVSVSDNTICSAVIKTVTVIASPTPAVTSAASETICNSTAQNYSITSDVSGTTYSWSRAAAAGISNTVISGQTANPITETSINTTNAPLSVTYVITPTANGCTGTAFNYVVTVNPTPTVTSPVSATVCNNAVQNYNITSGVNGTSYFWSRTAIAGISNASVNGQTANPITEALINTTNAPLSVTYVITPSANGCAGTPFNYVVTVNPTPTVTSPSSETVCNNTGKNYNITSAVTGAIYTWRRAAATGISNAAATGQTANPITEALVNTTNAPLSVTYVITPTANGCTGTPFNYVVMVNPTPTVTSPASETICNNTAQNYTITSAVTGANYFWSRTAIAGISNASVNGQTAYPITEALINTTDAPLSVTYVITPTANGCTGTPFNYVVTVNPTPTVTSPASATICNKTVQNYTITSAVSGTTYTWSRAAVTGISNAAVTGQSGNPITETLINPTSAPVSVTYVIIPTANGCPGTSFNYVVTVNPTPTVTSRVSATICNNTPQNYNITSEVTGTTYTWSRAAVAGISNAAVNGKTANPITEALSNTTHAPAIATYVITPTANGCTGTPFTYTVRVNPTLTVTSAVSATICSDQAQNYTITSAVSGTTYTWSRALVAGISNTAVNGQSGNAITETLINTTNAPLTVGYEIVPAANGCTGTLFHYAVTVNPRPATPLIESNSPVCTGTALNLTTPTITNATYTWTGPNNFSSTLQSPSIANTKLTNTGTYSLTVTVNGCSGNAGTSNVIINATPSAPKAFNNGPVCEGSALKLTATAIEGTIYNWTGPSGFTSATQNPTIANATFTDEGKYYVSATVAGCTGLADSSIVIVNENPTIPVLTSNSPVCTGSALLLTATTTKGADYSWTGPNGFTSREQNPTILNAVAGNKGTYNVSVSSAGCSSPGLGSIAVAVNQAPNAPVASNTGPVCQGSSLSLFAAATSGAIYNWTGPNDFTSTSQNPVITNITTAGAGTYSVRETVNGCTSTFANTYATIKLVPAAPKAGDNTPVCDGRTVTLTASAIPGATYSWTGPNGFTSATQNPTITNATFTNEGKYYISATVAGCTGPADSANVIINANPIPPGLSSNSPVCTENSLRLTAATVRGANYSWTGPNGFSSSSQNPIIPDAKLRNSGTYKVSITAAGCPSTTSSSVDVIVNQTPNAPTATNNSPVCEGSTLNLYASTVGGAIYNWTGPNNFVSTSQNPSISNTITGSATYFVTATVKGCTSAPGNTIAVIKQLATANAGNSQIVCANNSLVSIAGTVKGGTTTGIWSTNGTGTFSPANTNLTAIYTPANSDKEKGSVSLTLTSTNNGACPASVSSMAVTITKAPTANAGPDQSVCANKADVILKGQVTTATGGAWSTSGKGTFSPFNTNLNATYIPDARDIVKGTVTLTLTTTGNGNCQKSSDEMLVTITPAPVVKAGADRYILEASSILLEPYTSGTNLKYLWTPNQYLNNNTTKNPLVTGVEDLLYTLKVTDINGCVNEDQVMVKVLKPFKIPNTFTPNNDGINDQWLIPFLSTYPGNHVQVFNRYGQLVFESSGYAIPWDGTMNGKSLPFGTYYYIIEAGNGRKPLTGYVTIVK